MNKVEDYQENYITGWVKLYRSFIKWEWFDVPNMVTIFIYCLLKANYTEKKWRGITIQKGSFITSYDTISKDTGISIQSIRTCLDRLEQTKEINKESNKAYTVITICKYETYQQFEESSNIDINKQVTNHQQTGNKPSTTTNNNNNIKKDKKENIYRAFAHLKLSEEEFQRLITDGYTKSEIDDTLDDIENYKMNTKYKILNLTVRKWLKKNKPPKNNSDEGIFYHNGHAYRPPDPTKPYKCRARGSESYVSKKDYYMYKEEGELCGFKSIRVPDNDAQIKE